MLTTVRDRAVAITSLGGVHFRAACPVAAVFLRLESSKQQIEIRVHAQARRERWRQRSCCFPCCCCYCGWLL